MTNYSEMRTLSSLAAAVFCLSFTGCQNESQQPSAAERALDELQSKYDELLKDKFDVPVDWATEDLENIGDWEYRVVDLSYSSSEGQQSQRVQPELMRRAAGSGLHL